MPITGPASYIPTTEDFLNHWTSVNAALPVGEPFTIPGKPIGFDAPVTLATLQGLYDQLNDQHALVQKAISDDDLAGDDLMDQKTALLDKAGQFNEKVRGMLPGTKWERRLPLVPSTGDGRFKFVEPLETAFNLWTRINGDGALDAAAPLVLRDEYALAQFTADLVALRAAYRTAGTLDDALALEREERNDLQDSIYPALKQYRILMPTLFDPENALVDELPLLTPTGGRTPASVVATGTWDATQSKAKITWTASTDSDLSHYEVRWSPGTIYHSADESTLASIQPKAGLVFYTDQGLAVSGDKSLFEVYVVLNSGNEAASNAVTVLRV